MVGKLYITLEDYPVIISYANTARQRQSISCRHSIFRFHNLSVPPQPRDAYTTRYNATQYDAIVARCDRDLSLTYTQPNCDPYLNSLSNVTAFLCP